MVSYRHGFTNRRQLSPVVFRYVRCLHAVLLGVGFVGRHATAEPVAGADSCQGWGCRLSVLHAMRTPVRG